jgi:hypothetical protein
LTPGSGIRDVEKSKSGSEMDIPLFRIITIFWVKILQFFDAVPDPGFGIFLTPDPGIWDGKNSDPG